MLTFKKICNNFIRKYLADYEVSDKKWTKGTFGEMLHFKVNRVEFKIHKDPYEPDVTVIDEKERHIYLGIGCHNYFTLDEIDKELVRLFRKGYFSNFI